MISFLAVALTVFPNPTQAFDEVHKINYLVDNLIVNISSRQHSRHQQSSRFSALPPHPIPNPDHLSPNASNRRPRTPSMDRLYNATQPPPKRSRANTDEQRQRERRSLYSESVCLHFLVIYVVDRLLILFFVFYSFYFSIIVSISDQCH
jgi:hypothetical protein